MHVSDRHHSRNKDPTYEDELSQWREALLGALGANGPIMVNLIPELALIIGDAPPVPDLPAQDAQNRFQMVFRQFLGVFARADHPLALFLDDLQWLDAGTLDLLLHLVTHPDVRHVLLVGAYRDNEVGTSHPLTRTLDLIRGQGAPVQEIVLAPLTRDDVAQMVADSLHCERAITDPLAQLVHEKTAGNPFFATQFFQALADEHLLVFDRVRGAWGWDLLRIRAKDLTDNVVDLMTVKLLRLPKPTQEALGQLACLGSVNEIATLTLLAGSSEERVHEALWDAVRAGLVLRTREAYTFVHDRVQEAAYALIPDGERARAHLRIGRLLAAQTAAKVEESIFEIVNHLNEAECLITNREERDRSAELNLIAGKQAKAAAAFDAALAYFSAGLALCSDAWARRYALTFDLAVQHAECQCVTGHLNEAEHQLAMLSVRADNLVDRGAVARARIELYTNLDQSDRAVAIGLEFLHFVGIDWVQHPTDEEVEREYTQVSARLGGRAIEDLVTLSPMADPEHRATMDVLAAMHAPANFLDANLLAIIIARMANMSLEWGHADASAFAYVYS